MGRPIHTTLQSGVSFDLFQGEYGFELEITPRAKGVNQFLTLELSRADVLSLRDALVEFAG